MLARHLSSPQAAVANYTSARIVGQSGSEQLADAAATALGTLLSEAAPGQVGLDAASHAVGKLLWQQRTFTQASGAAALLG